MTAGTSLSFWPVHYFDFPTSCLLPLYDSFSSSLFLIVGMWSLSFLTALTLHRLLPRSVGLTGFQVPKNNIIAATVFWGRKRVGHLLALPPQHVFYPFSSGHHHPEATSDPRFQGNLDTYALSLHQEYRGRKAHSKVRASARDELGSSTPTTWGRQEVGKGEKRNEGHPRGLLFQPLSAGPSAPS